MKKTNYTLNFDYPTHVVAAAMQVEFGESKTTYINHDGKKTAASKQIKGSPAKQDMNCAYCGAPIAQDDMCVKTDIGASFTDTWAMYDPSSPVTCMPCAFFLKKEGLTMVQSQGSGMFGALYIADPNGKHTAAKALTHKQALKVFPQPTPKAGIPFVFIGRIYGWEASQGMQRHTVWKAVVNRNPHRYYLQMKDRKVLYDKQAQADISTVLQANPNLQDRVIHTMKHFDRLSGKFCDSETLKLIQLLEPFSQSSIEMAGMIQDCMQKAAKQETKKKEGKKK